MASSERTEAAAASSTATTGTAAPEAAELSPAGTAADAGTGKDRRGQLPRSVATAPTSETISVSCLMNAHYHASREAFLDTVHRWFMFGVIAFGAAALVDIFPVEHKEWLKALCSAGAALLGALDLTFDLSNRARMHSMMRRRYFELLADMREGKKSPPEAKVCLERYSGDEEPPYRVLLLACWNLAQAAVFGVRAKRFKITKWGLATKNFFRRPGVTYPVAEEQGSL